MLNSGNWKVGIVQWVSDGGYQTAGRRQWALGRGYEAMGVKQWVYYSEY